MIQDLLIISNDKDRRTLAWLLSTVGEDAIATAVSSLAGKRTPYLSNVCKTLGVVPPDSIDLTDREAAKAHLAAAKAMLKRT